MQVAEKLTKLTHRFAALPEWCISGLILFSLLWRGGKSLETTWFLGAVAAVASIFFFLEWNAKRKAHEKPHDVPSVLWVLGMFIVLWTVLSYIFSTTQNYGLDEVIRTASFMLLFFSVYRMASHEREGRAIAERFAFIFSLGVLIACVVGVFIYTLQPVDRFVGTFFDYRFHTDYWPNAWGEVLLLGIPLVLYTVWTFQRKFIPGKDMRLHPLLRVVIIGFVLGSFALSYSRASGIALVAEGALWLSAVFLLKKSELPTKKLLTAGTLILLVMLITFFGVNAFRGMRYSVQDVGEKVTFTASEGTSSISERSQFWEQAVELAQEKPLFGWGPYSFRFVQPRLQQYVLATSDHPHNVFLKFAMERGIPAALALLLFFVLIYLYAARNWLREEGETNERLFSLQVLLLIGCAGVLMHNLVDYNLQFVGVALPFWVFLAAGIGLQRISTKSISPAISRSLECFIATVLVLVLFREGYYLLTSSVGRHAEAAGDTEKAMQYYHRSDPEWFSRDLHLSKVHILIDAQRFATAQEALRKYTEQNTADPRADKRQGDIYAAKNEWEAAIAFYQKAYDHNRYNDLSILEGLINGYRALGSLVEITNRKAEYESLLRAYADAIERNAHFIALSPNVESFVRIANTMAELYPEDAPRYEVMAAKVDHHATTEREKIDSRNPGFLW